MGITNQPPTRIVWVWWLKQNNMKSINWNPYEPKTKIDSDGNEIKNPRLLPDENWINEDFNFDDVQYNLDCMAFDNLKQTI